MAVSSKTSSVANLQQVFLVHKFTYHFNVFIISLLKKLIIKLIILSTINYFDKHNYASSL